MRCTNQDVRLSRAAKSYFEQSRHAAARDPLLHDDFSDRLQCERRSGDRPDSPSPAMPAASAHPQCDIRRVDWGDFAFPSYKLTSGSYVFQGAQGRGRLDAAHVVDADLNKNGKLEAFVPVDLAGGDWGPRPHGLRERRRLPPAIRFSNERHCIQHMREPWLSTVMSTSAKKSRGTRSRGGGLS